MVTRHALFLAAALGCAAVPLTAGVVHAADEISMDALPKPAHDEIMKQAGTDKIEKVEKSTKDGKDVYEAKVRKADGKTYELKVDAAGKLLEKKD
jgi:hypothetical protein